VGAQASSLWGDQASCLVVAYNWYLAGETPACQTAKMAVLRYCANAKKSWDRGTQKPRQAVAAE
jgi:hypothetical protein